MPVIDISDSSVAGLGARLAMCVPEGGSNIELMCPADPQAPLSQSLQRFLSRRGEGLFALMLEAPVPDEEAVVLLDRGLNVLPLMEGAGGRDIHPKSTHGVLIRVYPVNSFAGRKEETDRSLGISGIARVIIAVADLDDAVGVYGDKLGLPVDAAVIDDMRGVESVLCHPPTGGVIELAAAYDLGAAFARSIARHIETKGEGMYGLVLRAADPAVVATKLSERGLAVGAPVAGVVETGVFGARIFIESAEA
jgi:catechol 2,3-dioxygenase-like lactoylglutathione lyase family enzyme